METSVGKGEKQRQSPASARSEARYHAQQCSVSICSGFTTKMSLPCSRYLTAMPHCWSHYPSSARLLFRAHRILTSWHFRRKPHEMTEITKEGGLCWFTSRKISWQKKKVFETTGQEKKEGDWMKGQGRERARACRCRICPNQQFTAHQPGGERPTKDLFSRWLSQTNQHTRNDTDQVSARKRQEAKWSTHLVLE